MSRFSCPCGLEVEVDAHEMLDFVKAHDCAFHTAVPDQPQPAGNAWAGVATSLLFVVLVLGVCVVCGWLVKT